MRSVVVRAASDDGCTVKAMGAYDVSDSPEQPDSLREEVYRVAVGRYVRTVQLFVNDDLEFRVIMDIMVAHANGCLYGGINCRDYIASDDMMDAMVECALSYAYPDSYRKMMQANEGR